ncbi:hypothetical protein QBC35DRAFT_495167 [Podospora australis]|uniref:Uncharacterized protein n=1 Tax=Podospora australis TaxID=1536484 RepID=A0AAN6WVA6_9PEZI|nr:hypothetical protein QBC35DRAFT_495167 [Podospora australis]
MVRKVCVTVQYRFYNYLCPPVYARHSHNLEENRPLNRRMDDFRSQFGYPCRVRVLPPPCLYEKRNCAAMCAMRRGGTSSVFDYEYGWVVALPFFLFFSFGFSVCRIGYAHRSSNSKLSVTGGHVHANERGSSRLLPFELCCTANSLDSAWGLLQPNAAQHSHGGVAWVPGLWSWVLLRALPPGVPSHLPPGQPSFRGALVCGFHLYVNPVAMIEIGRDR